MKAYRLLRNGQQSGPHTITELLMTGLRPQDMVSTEQNPGLWMQAAEDQYLKLYFFQAPQQETIRNTGNDLPEKKISNPDAAIEQETTTPPAINTQPEVKGIMIEIKDVKPENDQPLFEIRDKQEIFSEPAIENNTPNGPGKPRIRIKADAILLNAAPVNKVPFKTYAPPKKKLSSGSLDWQKGWLEWEQDRKEMAFHNREKQFTVAKQVVAKEPATAQQVTPLKNNDIAGSKPKWRFHFPVGYVFPVVALAIMTGLAFWIGTIEGRPTTKLEAGNTGTTGNDAEEQTLQPVESSLQEAQEPVTNDATVVYTVQKTESRRHNAANGKDGEDYSYAAGKKQADKANDIRVDQVNEADYTQPLPDNKVVTAAKKEEMKPASTVAKKQTVKDFIRIKNNSIALSDAGADHVLQVQNTSNIGFNLVVIDLQYYDNNGRYRKGETLYLRNFNAGKSLNVRIPEDESSVKATANVSMISSDENNVYLVAE